MSINRENPFEFEGANCLSISEIIEFYSEDYNYSRFLLSPRNIYLIGERGTGKTMALLYNSIKVRYQKSKNEKQNVDFKYIGIHVPCKSPLFDKREYLLLEDDFRASVVSEHYLVLTIASSITAALSEIPEIEESLKQLNQELISDFEYYLDINLDKTLTFLKSILKYVDKEVILTQKKFNNLKNDEYYENSLTFSSLILPLFQSLKKSPLLNESHFLLMIDDAHDLNEFQVKALNSWIAYRDHQHFSFKVASAKVNRPELITSSGGTILEGHDFTEIEMEKDFYNKDSEFSKMARNILQKRLESVNISININSFFPINPEFEKGLKESEEKVREEAKKKYPDGDKKKIADYVYKYGRAEYFRNRDPKANLPPYSGLETIIDISTGIIRNLLDPCYWMFDNMLSDGKHTNSNIKFIPPSIQSQIIKNRSDYMWSRLMLRGLDKEIGGCTKQQSERIFHFFDNLMILFRERLLKHKSLPRAIEFYISQKDERIMTEIEPLFVIAQKAQLLYTRIGSGKDSGKKEIYYIPNRMLLPTRGLDPKGQYDRVGLKAIDIWNTVSKNVNFPYNNTDTNLNQLELGYEKN